MVIEPLHISLLFASSHEDLSMADIISAKSPIMQKPGSIDANRVAGTILRSASPGPLLVSSLVQSFKEVLVQLIDIVLAFGLVISGHSDK